MIKNAIIYRIASDFKINLQSMEDALQAAAFTPCGATQDRSAGFVPPREKNGAMVESIGGHLIANAMIETKSVPTDIIKRKADEWAARTERDTGRKPGKKEMKAIREEALMALLPMAFPKQSAHLIWIDPEARTLVIDASSQGKADEIITGLVMTIPGFSVSLLQTKEGPQACMTKWLTEEPEDWPVGICVERGCELRSTDEEKSVVRFTRHNLQNEEIRQHIAQGKLPVKLALNWEGRVDFVLTDAMQLKSIEFLDVVFADSVALAADGFDADVVIMAGELSAMLAGLIDALGGAA